MGWKRRLAGGNQERPAWSAAQGPLLAGIAAASSGLALSPPHMPWLVFISLLTLFVAIRVLPPLRAMLCGAVWGGAFCVSSILSGAAEFEASLGVVALLTLVPAVYAGAGAMITRWVGFSPLTLATGWIAVELALRPLGLQTGLLAGTVLDGATFHLLGGVFGYVFVAFVVAYLSAWTLEVAAATRLWQIRPLRPVVAHDPYRLLDCMAVFWSPLATVRISQARAPPA